MFNYLSNKIKSIIAKIPVFYFSIPNKNSIIIFDEIEKDIFSNILNSKNLYFIRTRNNRINIIALIYSCLFFYRSNIKIEYLNFFLKMTKSKLILSFSFKRLILYEIKKYYPNVKVLIIQNGLFGNQFTDLIINSNKTNLICDYFFCMSKFDQIVLKNYIKTKFVIIGSLRSNSFPIKKLKKLKQMTFISQFRKGFREKKILKNLYYTEKKLLPILHNFCEKKKIKFKILPGRDNFQIENDHYKEILKSDNFFLYKKDVNQSYNIIDSSMICAGIDSTLVFEGLSRSNKIAFFNFGLNLPKNKYDISYILQHGFSKEGKFWLNYYNKKKINKILEYLYNTKIVKWKKQNISKINQLPYYKNNIKLKKILKKIILNI